MKTKTTVIDLFAGAGGLSLGAARAGFDVLCAVEWDKHALKTHSKNFPNTRHLDADLFKLSPKELLDIVGIRVGELGGLIGGPPCQGFSFMGKRDVADSRNNLFVHFFDFVSELQPAFFIAENVQGILSPQYDGIRKAALQKISKKYVVLPPQVIRANEYGAPTTRTRVFFIGFDPKKIRNITTEEISALKVSAEQHIYVKDALLGLPEDVSTIYGGTHKVSSSLSKAKTIKRLSCFVNHIMDNIPKAVGNQEAIRLYKSRKLVSGCLPTHHSQLVIERYARLKYGEQDKISKSTKLNPDGFCPTLRAGTGPEKGSYQAVRPIHYKQPRVITPREAARLQGFPDWFEFDETIWHSFRQIGNSVSPIVAEKILLLIYQKLT